MRYISTPFRISLPSIPQPAAGAVPTAERTDGEVQMPETLNISGGSTPETSADRAKRETEALLRECQERVVAGHGGAILELLDINPDFIQHAWVRAKLAREMNFQRAEMVEAGRTIKRTFDDPQLGRVEFGLTGL